MTANYPKRPQFFACYFTRLLFDAGVTENLTPRAIALLVYVVHAEDAQKYKGAIRLWNSQLMEKLGFRSPKQLAAARQSAVQAGWLHYSRASNQKSGRYFVTIPPSYAQAGERTVDAHHSEDQADIGTKQTPKRGSKPAAQIEPQVRLRSDSGTKVGTESGTNPGKHSIPFPKPDPSPPQELPEPEWQQVLQAATAVGLSELRKLQAARNRNVPVSELAAIVQYYASQRAVQGWSPGALAHRLDNTFPGQPLAHGWPQTRSTRERHPADQPTLPTTPCQAPCPHCHSARDIRWLNASMAQCEDCLQTFQVQPNQAQSTDSSRLNNGGRQPAQNLEQLYGSQVDALSVCEINELVRKIAPDVSRQYQRDPHSKVVRKALLQHCKQMAERFLEGPDASSSMPAENTDLMAGIAKAPLPH